MPTTFFLLFGLMDLGFAVFTYFMFDIFIFSNYRNAKRCTQKTEGVIIRYSYALYNGISLPVVEYTVDGNLYKVVGPKFLSAISNTISTPLGSIVSDVKTDNFENGEIPQVLRYKVKGNSFLSYTKSPLKERFPIGGKVAVYYDPKSQTFLCRKTTKTWAICMVGKMFYLSQCFYYGCSSFLYHVHSSKYSEIKQFCIQISTTLFGFYVHRRSFFVKKMLF